MLHLGYLLLLPLKPLRLYEFCMFLIIGAPKLS